MGINRFSAQTQEDFNRARNKALINEIQHILKPSEASLISLADVKSLVKTNSEAYLGMKTIPVARIVGSEGRYKDFDSQFFPKNSFMRQRWERVDEANISDIALPPIKVYELAGLYFVRDGNHRVSVAKAKGVEFIDAEVVSLKSEIKLAPVASLAGMTRQIIFYEKREFYSETAFGDITDFWGLDFTTAGQYDVIYNHILTHKYYLSQRQNSEASMDDAIMSWFASVYRPIVLAIDARRVMRRFKGRTRSDLYVWIIKYWDDLKSKFGGDIPLDDAVSSFKKEYRRPLRRRIVNWLQKIRLAKR